MAASAIYLGDAALNNCEKDNADRSGADIGSGAVVSRGLYCKARLPGAY